MQRWLPQKIDGVPDGLVLFDGVCVLCSGWVRFLIARDKESYFRFTPIQSRYGRALSARLGIDPDDPETNVTIVGGRAYFKLDTVMQGLGRIPRWRLVWALTRWRLLGIPLPRWSVPNIECIEGTDGERFTFDIDVRFPLIGWLIHYRGWIVPQPS